MGFLESLRIRAPKNLLMFGFVGLDFSFVGRLLGLCLRLWFLSGFFVFNSLQVSFEFFFFFFLVVLETLTNVSLISFLGPSASILMASLGLGKFRFETRFFSFFFLRNVY